MLRVAGSLSAFALLAACGSESIDGPSAAPATIRAGTGNGQTGEVGAVLAVPLSVTVSAADGKPVSNATVSWDVSPGGGSTSSGSTRTDGNGVTQVTWTLGANAGSARVTAQVGGVSPLIFTATAQPGTAAVIVSLPDVLSLGIGDTVTVTSSVRDQFGNELTGSPVAYSVPDPGVLSISGNGFVTALAQGTARVIAASSGRVDTVQVTVGAAGSSPCGATAVSPMTVGQVITTTSRLCLSGGTLNAEYAVIAFASSTSFASTTRFDIFGQGLVTPTAPLTAALSGGSAFDMGYGAFTGRETSPWLNRDAELARREIERKELTGLVDMAREEYAARNEENVDGLRRPAALRAVPKVGDVLKLNTQALQGCSNSALVDGVVKAVGTRSVLVADPGNPGGGYTDADYQSFVATFDTLVYPIGVENFGTPTNIGGNDRVILFLTKSVNQLTPPSSSFVIGGFFFSRDLYPKTARNGLLGCAGSNEAEMFYLLVPDPQGTINGNRRAIADVTRLNLGTIGHEFQHLINSSRRLYVNTGAAPNEETWLDEGLSHVAEELLYFRISGFGSRDNLNLANVGGTTSQNANFSSYMTQNFSRLYDRLRNPEVTSPYATNDSLSTRGAIWSFLRYAAGRQPVGGEPAFFRGLANATTTGLANLNSTLPNGQLATYLNDWAVATFADDFVGLPAAQLDDRYKFPSWNFRSIYPNLRITGPAPLGVYPLATRTLRSNVSQRLNLAGGGAGYLRFAVAPNRTGVVSVSTNGGPAATSIKFSVMRVR
ncbi:MAG: hypothetical protein H7Z40_05220 [Phycisphaerae bacterium]|nr:hypothetical protein [Gemmatimonadaceae bacterium]